MADEAAGWQTRAPMQVPRDHMSGAALNGAIYSIGGALDGNEDQANQKRVDYVWARKFLGAPITFDAAADLDATYATDHRAVRARFAIEP